MFPWCLVIKKKILEESTPLKPSGVLSPREQGKIPFVLAVEKLQTGKEPLCQPR